MRHFMISSFLYALIICMILAVASASISMTLTQTELFAPLRNWAKSTGHMIGHLFQCFYCMSHWVVILGILIYQSILIHSGYIWVDLIISVFFTITLTTFICGIMFKVFLTGMNKAVKEQELKKHHVNDTMK
ncbi:DUF1360 domain-containing protein [Acinetobacter sp. ANC 4558]|nr:DUF1360 domain-containing protein [Acinetobacter sp. ANC 4558]